MVHQEAARAGELVRLPRDHADSQLFARQVRTRQLESLSCLVRVDVDRDRVLARRDRVYQEWLELPVVL